MKTSIFDTLEKLNLSSERTRFLFNQGTRDNSAIKVWKDRETGVVYIDDFYTGDQTYVNGAFREEKKMASAKTGKYEFERDADTTRRFDSSLEIIEGKVVADFGCGRGDFIKLAKSRCKEIMGIELEKAYIDNLNKNNIYCVDNLSKIEDKYLDVVCCFHVLEHLPNPLDTLQEMRKKLAVKGKIIIEVPHANDLLLSKLENKKFKEFTLWTQHLILHTKESLRRMLQYCGFKNIMVQGIQRYSLSNHLYWLHKGMPGGHTTALSSIDTEELNKAYLNSLSSMDATDTLFAFAEVP